MGRGRDGEVKGGEREERGEEGRRGKERERRPSHTPPHPLSWVQVGMLE